MASQFKNPDHEALAKICDVLGIDRSGLTELVIEWNIKGLIAYTTKYIHVGRKRVEISEPPSLEQICNTSWRDNPQL